MPSAGLESRLGPLITIALIGSCVLAVTVPVTATTHPDPSSPTNETARSSFQTTELSVPNESSFQITEVSVPNATVGTRFIVTANITNPSQSRQTQTVELRFEGELLDREEVTLDAGETDTIHFQAKITPQIVNTSALPGWRFVTVLTPQHGTVAWFYLNTTEATEQPHTKTADQKVTATQISIEKLDRLLSTPIENLNFHRHLTDTDQSEVFHLHYKSTTLTIWLQDTTLSFTVTQSDRNVSTKPAANTRPQLTKWQLSTAA